MSGHHPSGSDEPTADRSLPTEASGDHPPHGGHHDEHPATTSERYWQIFNDPGLSPPDGAPADSTPVSPEAFQDLARQVRALIEMVQTIIPLVSHPVHPPAIEPLRQRKAPVRAHMTLPEPPTSPRIRPTPLGDPMMANLSGRSEPEALSSDSLRAQLRFVSQ